MGERACSSGVSFVLLVGQHMCGRCSLHSLAAVCSFGDFGGVFGANASRGKRGIFCLALVFADVEHWPGVYQGGTDAQFLCIIKASSSCLSYRHPNKCLLVKS